VRLLAANIAQTRRRRQDPEKLKNKAPRGAFEKTEAVCARPENGFRRYQKRRAVRVSRRLLEKKGRGR
jgi:hypothetical protein